MKPDYDPESIPKVRAFATRGALLTAFAIGLWLSNGGGANALSSILLAAGIGYLAVSSAMLWSSRVGRLKARDGILDGLTWRGDEKVLDVGCGHGLFLVGVAKRLKSGRVTGVDIPRGDDLSSSVAEDARANAKAEGVFDRIKIETADPGKLPFADATFDVVLSSMAIHNIEKAADRAAALREMARVSKPGGRLVIVDSRHTSEYAKVLQQIGLANVLLSSASLAWCVPTRSVTARNP